MAVNHSAPSAAFPTNTMSGLVPRPRLRVLVFVLVDAERVHDDLPPVTTRPCRRRTPLAAPVPINGPRPFTVYACAAPTPVSAVPALSLRQDLKGVVTHGHR